MRDYFEDIVVIVHNVLGDSIRGLHMVIPIVYNEIHDYIEDY